MATQHPSPALHAPASSPAYPMAKPGYGKRSAPDQHPRTREDFALLPTRERYVAGFIDHLPEAAAMSVKVLAQQLPLYGQQAIGSALKALSVAGHLRRVRCAVGREGQVRWVSRTFWSRTARDNEWWNAFLATERASFTGGTSPTPAPTSATAPPPSPWMPEPTPGPGPGPEPVPHREPAPGSTPAPTPVPQQRTTTSAPPPPPHPPRTSPPASSPAYLVLAQLGQVDRRVGLSAEDCDALEGLAAAWLERGVTADYVVHALTAGLPSTVDSPVGFVRRRLENKIPPHQPTTGPTQPPPSGVPAPRLLVECTECAAPGRPEALPDGLCRRCRSGTEATEGRTRDDGIPVQRDIGTYVSEIRDRLKLP
ncbi:MarR family transcriptional regulator [Streptomyces sp. SID8374]|uniref:MarR family transcriptional regulator n=1 Tax=Streptomyces sp. SID8374 TaxID=2690354 RepID=UPI00136D5868|nr:MarR family transcriptional regulator [Streptomyces sp. SID8374]